jgi:hypothetical protein
MSLLAIVGILLLAGLLLWAVSALPWIDAGIKRLIYIVVVVVIGVWLISSIFGVHLGSVHV